MGYKQHRAPTRDNAGGFWLADLYASAFLVAWGHRIDRIEPTGEDGRCAFVFVADDGLEAHYAAYRSDAEIPALTFVNTVYDLKGLIKDAMRSEHEPRNKTIELPRRS
jgi:hypothetical protein